MEASPASSSREVLVGPARVVAARDEVTRRSSRRARLAAYASRQVSPSNAKSPPKARRTAAFHRSSCEANARRTRLHRARAASAGAPTPSSSSASPPPPRRRRRRSSGRTASAPRPSRRARGSRGGDRGGDEEAVALGEHALGCARIGARGAREARCPEG